MPRFTIHVPFEQCDSYEVEAETVEDAIERARDDPSTRTAVNINDEVTYDWDSAILTDEDDNQYNADGRKL